MWKLAAPFVLLFAAVIAAVVSDRPQPPSDYRFINGSAIFTLDPQRMTYNQDIRIGQAIYDGLVRWNPYTFEIIPGVAHEWEVSPDGLVYTFHIREDAKFSNGDPITAEAFVYSWQRALMPDTAADYTQLLFALDGGEAFFNWRSDQLAQYAQRPVRERTPAAAKALRDEADEYFRNTVGVEPLDERTLRVTLAGPVSYFLDLCAFPTFAVVHPPTVDRFVTIDPATGRLDQSFDWTKPPHIVTSGAYRVASWRFKRDMRLEKNEHYWDRDRVVADSITSLSLEDPNTRVLTFLTGGADWDTDVLVNYVGDMLAQKEAGERSDIHAYPRFGTYFWSFNCTPTLTGGQPNPFHDPRVRRAFAMATNKQDIVDKVRRLGEQVANTFIPPQSIPGFDEEERIRGVGYDPVGAKALLAEAGWVVREGDVVPTNAAGEQFPIVELLCSTGSYHEKVALAMGDMWQNALGVRSRIVVKESKTYKDDLKRKDYMLARGGWYGDYGDPTTFLSLHKTGDGNNDRGYSDPRFDALLDAADRETDPEKRMALLEEAERYTMEETLPILPVWSYTTFFLWEEGEMVGISDHPRLMQYLQWIAPREVFEKKNIPEDHPALVFDRERRQRMLAGKKVAEATE